MNLYPEQLEYIARFCRALNDFEKEFEGKDGIPFPKAIELTDEHGTDYGKLRDEIGVSWSWFAPEPKE